MNGFRVSKDLILPPDAVTQAFGILARKDAGKTYTAKVFAEEIIAARVPTCIIDPTGAWWGLRSSADGLKPGLPVTILGGSHGDAPLEPSEGKLYADTVLDHPGAFILDLSAFESRRAEVIFAAAFFDRLYRRKQPETGPMMLIVDEADVFAPQRPGPEATKSLGALESIVRRGRIKGLGDMLLTQRAAVLNKNVLTQTECLIVLQTTSPQDRAAIKDWIEGNADSSQQRVVLDSLASLERGEAWVWSPSWLRKLVKVQIRPLKTFNSSRTPEPGEIVAPKTFAKVDLEKLGTQIAESRERAKENDPTALKAEVRRLRRELEDVREIATVREIEKPVPYFDPVVRDEIDGLLREIRDHQSNVDQIARSISSKMQMATMKDPPPVGVAQAVERPVEARKAAGSTPAPDTKILLNHAMQNVEMPLLVVTQPMGAILNVLAQFQNRTQSQVSLLSGYSPTSGSFKGALASLRKFGLIEGDSKALKITPSGETFAGDVEQLPRPGPELMAYWTGKLPAPEGAILTALAGIYPGEMAQSVVAETTRYSPTSGSFKGALAKLRKLDLITGSSTGLRIVSDLVEG